jgi:hypothetical protein
LKKILIEDLNKIKNPFARSYARHLNLKRKSLSTLAEIREIRRSWHHRKTGKVLMNQIRIFRKATN